jgi:hypothetical protein
MAKRRPNKPRARSQKSKDAPASTGDEEAPKDKGGRPSILVGGDLKVFLDEVSIGTPLQSAALVAGFKRGTVYAAIKAGRNQEKAGKYGEARKFLDAFRKARASAEASYVHRVASGAAGDEGVAKEQKCPHCGEEIVLPMPRAPRMPDTTDAKFMLKAINPRVWNVDKAPGMSNEKPISRLELVGAFQLMGTAVAQEVEDPNARRRIGDRWREIYRTLGLDEDKAQIVERQKPILDQQRLGNGSQHHAGTD